MKKGVGEGIGHGSLLIESYSGANLCKHLSTDMDNITIEFHGNIRSSIKFYADFIQTCTDTNKLIIKSFDRKVKAKVLMPMVENGKKVASLNIIEVHIPEEINCGWFGFNVGKWKKSIPVKMTEKNMEMSVIVVKNNKTQRFFRTIVNPNDGGPLYSADIVY